MRCQPVILCIGLMAFVLSSCAHSAGWRSADPGDMPFDGEHPDMVRAITASDTVLMPHPVVRGDSLVGRYGHGEAVALDGIVELEEYESGSEGLGTGGVIAITVLSVVAALAVAGAIACSGDDYIC